MTRKQIQKRIGTLCNELARLSRNSWQDAKPCDYEPLERELRALYEARERRRQL